MRIKNSQVSTHVEKLKYESKSRKDEVEDLKMRNQNLSSTIVDLRLRNTVEDGTRNVVDFMPRSRVEDMTKPRETTSLPWE